MAQERERDSLSMMPAIYEVEVRLTDISQIASIVPFRRSAIRGMYSDIIVILRYRSVALRK